MLVRSHVQNVDRRLMTASPYLHRFATCKACPEGRNYTQERSACNEGISFVNDRRRRWRYRLGNDSLKHKPLNTLAVFDFRRIKIATEVRCHFVERIKLTWRDSRRSKVIERLECFSVVYPDARRASAGDIQIPLVRIRRESHARSRLAISARLSNRFTPSVDPYLRLIFAFNRKDLYPLASTVRHINQPVV